MKAVFTAVSAALVACALGAGAAEAMPRIDGVTAGALLAAPHVEKARVVCNYRRCYRVGGYRYYRPYGYYYRPGFRVGVGPFGVGIY